MSPETDLHEDLPEHLDDAEAEEVEAQQREVPRSGPLRFARMTGLLDRRPRRRAVGHRLPQRRLLPPRGRRARGRRPALRLQRPDDLLVQQGHAAAPARQRPRRVPQGLRRRALRHRPLGARHARRASSCEEGAARLIGDWFPEAYADDARRGWGIAFATVADREAYNPERRHVLARLGELTPETAPLDEQIWHTYPPVAMPSAEAVIGALTRARDVAGLRVARSAASRRCGRRAGRADVRDRGRRRDRLRPPDLHARVRDDHGAGHARRPGGAGGVVRRAGGRPGALRQGRAARGARGRRRRWSAST